MPGGNRTIKEVVAVRPKFDTTAVREARPQILKRAAIRTALFTLVALALMTGIAYAAGDPTGAATGDIGSVTVAEEGAKVAVPEGMELSDVASEVGHLKISTNVFFVIIGVALIFFMQAGFMLVETGFCRGRNAAHVAMTNFVIFAIGALAYWAAGFAIQFGSLGPIALLGGAEGVLSGEPLRLFGQAVAGTKGFFLGSLGDGTYDVGAFAFFLFQMVFMDTAATIVTGGMAERWKFSAFVPFGVFMAVVTYPLYGMWVWGGGWLAQLGANYGLGNGVVDFAGSSVVHAIGGFSALAGAIILGPRIGKFGTDGKPRAIPGHHIPMAILGTIILVFGWMGFNGMSTLAAGDLRFTIIIANTILAGSAGAIAAMGLVWALWKHPDPSMTANGMLAGLVAITAPCAFVTPWASVIIGAIGGLFVVGSVIFVERVMKVDDPVGAVSVHGVNGLWGMIALGLFADGTYGAGLNGVESAVTGLFYGNASQLGAQAIAAVVVAAWAFGTMFVFFKAQDALMGIRSSAADELAGLDVTELGVAAYPEFGMGTPQYGPDDVGTGPDRAAHPAPAPRPVGGEA